jgi:hypothetical protein
MVCVNMCGVIIYPITKIITTLNAAKVITLLTKLYDRNFNFSHRPIENLQNSREWIQTSVVIMRSEKRRS